MSKKVKSIGLPVGGASLIMAFMLLCLTTFSVISYMSAKRDYVLSEKTAENTLWYYDADGKGEEILKQIVMDINNGLDQNKITEKYSDYNLVSENAQEGININYSVNIKENMDLNISVVTDGKTTDIKTWKTTTDAIIDGTMIIPDMPVF